MKFAKYRNSILKLTLFSRLKHFDMEPVALASFNKCNKTSIVRYFHSVPTEAITHLLFLGIFLGFITIVKRGIV